MQAVTSVVVDNHNDTSVVVDQIDTGADLSSRGRGKDVTGNAGSKHTLSDETSLSGLVTSTTTRDDSHLVVRVRGVIDDLVWRVVSQSRVLCNRTSKVTVHETMSVIEEMLGSHLDGLDSHEAGREM